MSPRFPQQTNARPVDPLLNEKVVALANAPSAYLQDQLLVVLYDQTAETVDAEGNPIPTPGWTGTIQRVNEGAMFGDPNITTLVARAQTIPTYEGAGYDPMSYEADKYAILVEIPEEDRHIVQSGATSNTDVQLAGAVELMKLDREKRFEQLFMTITNWRNSATLGAAAKWDVQATSDPNEDLSTAVYTIAGYGMKANVCILGRKAADLLRKNAAFLEFDDMTKDRTILNDERLKEVISSRYGIRHVFIGEAVTKTAGDDQTDDMTSVNIWDDDVWVGYLPMNDDGTPAMPTDAESNVLVNDITMSQMDAAGSLFPMQKMAAGMVKVEEWSLVEDDSAGFTEDTKYHKVKYVEAIFPVLEPLGYVIKSVAT